MKKTQKSLSLLMAFAMLLSATSCGTNPSTSSASSTASQGGSASYTSLDDFKLFDADKQMIRTGRNDTGEKGVVSTSKYEASKIGRQVMEEGGNAVDAAVAAAFTLGLVEPNSSGLGGGGFMTIHLADGTNHFVDFREVAPQAATPAMWEVGQDGKVKDNANMVGGKSTGVPGEVAGMLYALDKYGTKNRKDVIQPVIDLANKGFTVTPTLADDMTNCYENMQKFPEFGKLFLGENGMPYEVGQNFVNKDYAKALQIISDKGTDGFYKGEIAQKMVEMNNKYNGLLTMDDLANYKVKDVDPVEGTYRGYKVISSPAPSSGGTIIIEILNILENFDLPKMQANSADELHLFSEAFKLAYADRAKYMGDPKYVDVPLKGLMSKEFAKTRAQLIDTKKSAATVDAGDPFAYEHQETTHFSIADKAGNMVSVTQTVNGYFGSSVCADGYGFMLNNEMGDFSPDAKSPNCIAGGKCPLSSMSPTVVLKEDGTPLMVLGSPGGTTIISTVAQTISKVVDHGMGMQEAVDAPRISGYSNNTNSYETRISSDVVDALSKLGHTMKASEEWNRGMGSVQAVLYKNDGTLEGAADPRRDGKALGF